MAKKVEITPPADLPIGKPENGQRMDLMTEYEYRDGKLCLVSIEGHPMPGYNADGTPSDAKEEAAEGEYPAKSQFAQKVMAARGMMDDESAE